MMIHLKRFWSFGTIFQGLFSAVRFGEGTIFVSPVSYCLEVLDFVDSFHGAGDLSESFCLARASVKYNLEELDVGDYEKVHRCRNFLHFSPE